ncbi:hypothetical protein BDA99DRAFT_536959 [Phascolomyces articulosus]|uniref:PH domain-containing protein n=1 Tax=Phascolomyces articulosus TaxID=60185 RepID=A0AAD5KBD3_9FUNG|nr:hypothetical protein BDA99DRAFT_536959 [Phascolomyces articulosus]
MSGSFSYTPQVQGWLLKQRHGICKSWLRRFFVLEGNELRYYKSEVESIPQCVIPLDNYQVVTDVIPIALPLILKKQPQRQYTFLLLSKDKQKTERSDLFLQAETQEELDIWVNALQLQQLNDSTSVLDKWLERLDDMHSTTPPPPTTTHHHLHHTTSTASTLSSSSAPAFLSPTKQHYHHHHPTRRPPLRGHRSSESLGASSISSVGSHSTATTSHRSSFGELRRTSNPSTLSSATSSPSATGKDNKFFANIFHHWPRSKSPAGGSIRGGNGSGANSPSLFSSHHQPSLHDEYQYEEGHQQQQQQQQGKEESAVVIAPALPIIHPSEYNKVYEQQPISMNLNKYTDDGIKNNHGDEGGEEDEDENASHNNDTSSSITTTTSTKRQSLASRRNVQVAPITNPNRLSRGRSCSSLVLSDSSTDSIVDRFPRVLTTPTLGVASNNGVNGNASFDHPAN